MAEKRKVGVPVKDSILKKRYPGAGLASEIFLEEDETPWLPCRALGINHLTGGGIMYGHILEGYGEESTGKTLLAIDFGCAAQALDGVVIWNDAEGTFSRHWAKSHGMSMNRLELYPTQDIIEVMSDWFADLVVKWRSILTRNQPILLVIDSQAALETQDNLDASQQDRKAEMGNRAKAFETFLRSRKSFFHKYGVCVYSINQVRKKIGATKWEDPDTTPGGSAMKFYASLRLGLYRGKQIKDKYDERVGQKVYVRVKKNKLAPPRERLESEVYFIPEGGKYGYSRYAGVVEVLIKEKVIKKKGNAFYFKDKKIAAGREAMEAVLIDNPELRSKLLKRSSINTISKTKAKLEAIKKNLYPVTSKVKKSEEDGEE